MWGKPPLYMVDHCAVDVRNLAAARKWYKEKLGLCEAKTDREEDSGRPFADLHISNDDAFLSLVELEPGKSAENRHVILFTKNLDKAHQWLAGRGVTVEPTATDSGGNRLFRLQDLEGPRLRYALNQVSRAVLNLSFFKTGGRTDVRRHQIFLTLNARSETGRWCIKSFSMNFKTMP